MKKATIAILLLAGYTATSTLLTGCSGLNKLTVDERRLYDSLEQVYSGRPNDGGVFDGEDEALEATVNIEMMKKVKKENNSSNQTSDQNSIDSAAIEDAKNPTSILRVEGSLFGIIANPHGSKTLTINIFRHGGGTDGGTLLPKHYKEFFLPPGMYDIQYILNGTGKEWWAKDYTVTKLNNKSYPVTKGWREEKLLPGSMDKYGDIIRIQQDKSIPLNFGFVGPGF